MPDHLLTTTNERQRGLMDERQLAEFLGIKPDTIRKWRVFKKGPRAIKVGHLIRYREADVEDWIATCPEAVTGSR
jgi:excisionase family DNA binding protein